MYLFLTVLLLKRTEALQYVLVTTGLKVQPGQPRMRGWEKIPSPVIARDGAQHKGIHYSPVLSGTNSRFYH